MIAFVDNDVITKLAACDLLEASLAALRLTINDVLVLSSARFSLRVQKNRKKGEERYGVATHGRICNFIGQAKVAAATPAKADLELLSKVPGIDEGEVVLVALCARTPDSILLTGDRRALSALGMAPGLDEIRAALKGRIYCLERIVTIVVNELGFERALPFLVSGCAGDNILKSACGSGLNTTEASAREALNYYESDLRKSAGDLLVSVSPSYSDGQPALSGTAAPDSPP